MLPPAAPKTTLARGARRLNRQLACVADAPLNVEMLHSSRVADAATRLPACGICGNSRGRYYGAGNRRDRFAVLRVVITREKHLRKRKWRCDSSADEAKRPERFASYRGRTDRRYGCSASWYH